MDAERHQGRVVAVTGGGSGIGRATALRFAREGAAHVVVVDRREDRIATVVGELQALGAAATGVVADLADLPECTRAVEAAVAAAGRLDVAVSNAAAWTEKAFLELTDEEWLRVVGVDLNASFGIGRAAARQMVAQGGGGSILYTVSISALGASPLFANYCAAKAGTANLVKTMAVELAPHRIRVNAVSPGPSDTQQSVDLVGEELMDKWREEGFPIVPLGRLGSPEDMAAAFSYLASDEAAYVTGVNLVVDGGLTAHAYSVPAS